MISRSNYESMSGNTAGPIHVRISIRGVKRWRAAVLTLRLWRNATVEPDIHILLGACDTRPSVPIRSCDIPPRGPRRNSGGDERVTQPSPASVWRLPPGVETHLPVPCLAPGLRGLWRKNDKSDRFFWTHAIFFSSRVKWTAECNRSLIISTWWSTLILRYS